MFSSFSLLLLLCSILGSSFAAVVYSNDYSVSMGLISRSTFSSDTNSSAPETVNYVNFKVTNSSGGGQIDYLSPVGSNVPYMIKTSSSKVSVMTDQPWSLITLIAAPSNCSSSYESIFGKHTSNDDVWSQAFMDHLVLAPGKCGNGWASSISSSFHSKRWNNEGSSSSPTILSSSIEAASGPYLLLSNQPDALYPVYRVYTDYQYAFTSGLLPKDSPSNISSQSFIQSPTGGQDSFAASSVSVPVPSRLYFDTKYCADKPLYGLRVAVKDIYDIAGVRTGCGNRAYYALYNDAATSSYPVQQLLEKGAIIVGKTKSSQFANGETATADWVDQLCPFNPRGDGYQDPSSSSSGSGAGLGAYDWVDVTVGSDTGGSIRGPAGVNGLLGIRPSIGAISLEGVMPLSDVQDTSGYFARDAYTFSKVGDAFYGDFVSSKNKQEYVSKLKTILVPSEFWEGYVEPTNGSTVIGNDTFGSAATDFANFINKVASFVGGATIDQSAFESKWNASGQSDAHGSLDTYLNLTYPVLIGDYQYRVLAQPFIDTYKAAHDGREPFVDPVPLIRWAFAQDQGPNAYQDALNEQDTFRSFIRNDVLPSNCSTLLMYPQADGTPNPRNQYFEAPGAPYGFGSGRIANFAGVPEIVIPIGQATFNSTITKSTKDSLPVAISIIGGYHCEGQLFKLASSLESAGITKSVKVGPATF